MSRKIYFILGISLIVALVQGVPLDENDNQIANEDNSNSHELSEDEIYAKVTEIHNKLEEDLKNLEERATENRKKVEDEQEALEEEIKPLIEKFEEISKQIEAKLNEINYPELRKNKKKLAEDSKELWENVGELGSEYRRAKDEYLMKQKDCLGGKFFPDSGETAEECEEKLEELKKEADKVDKELSEALDSLKTKHQEANDLYKKIEDSDKMIAEWANELFESEKENLKKLQEISNRGTEFMVRGKMNRNRLDEDKQKLRDEAKSKMRKLMPNLTLEWVRWNTRKRVLPANVIAAGSDIDNSVLYIARRKDLFGFGFEYGKCANNRDCFVTDHRKEKGAVYVDVLTGENFKWCKGTGNDIVNDEFPICRAHHEDTITPGTLLNNGKCRIGYGWEIFEKEDYEVLKQGKC